jgi:hypothetical protein
MPGRKLARLADIDQHRWVLRIELGFELGDGAFADVGPDGFHDSHETWGMLFGHGEGK